MKKKNSVLLKKLTHKNIFEAPSGQKTIVQLIVWGVIISFLHILTKKKFGEIRKVLSQRILTAHYWRYVFERSPLEQVLLNLPHHLKGLLSVW